MTVVLGLILLLLVAGALERRDLIRARARVPIRIHVNGTRGKSSVVRLVAAGLRAGGIRTCAKTTGTVPRFILPDGREVPIHRPGRPNVKEQVKVFRRAAAEGAEALVIECMALQPEVQTVSEDGMVRATIGVVTNVRPDHLDVMGPTLEDVGRTLARTVPRGGLLFTSERAPEALEILHEAARRRGTRVVVAPPDVRRDRMSRFSYVEHPENVALALAVCAAAGVPPERALEGMWAAAPDPGALHVHKIAAFGKILHFVNAFAANDPVSTLAIWRWAEARYRDAVRVVVFFHRDDRVQRGEQFAEVLAGAWRDVPAILIGGETELVRARAIRLGADPDRLRDMGGATSDEVLDEILSRVPPEGHGVVFGCGNIVGAGGDLARHLVARAVGEEAA